MKLIIATALIIISGINAKTAAQPISFNARVKPVELLLHDYKKGNSVLQGKTNVTTVTQVNDTAYYFVKGLSIYAPCYFNITAAKGAGNIKVNLCKDNWNSADRSGETGANGFWEEKFKTEGTFGIMVIAENKPVEYAIVFWTGAEAKEVGISSPFKKIKATDKEGEKGIFKNSVMLYGIIGVLIVSIIILIMKRKRKTITKGPLIMLFLSAISLSAKGQLTSDNVTQIIEIESRRSQQGDQREAAHSTAIDGGITRMNTVLNAVNDAQTLYNASRALGRNECTPVFETDQNAMLPSSCSMEGECAECYRDAVGKLTSVRRQLGRLNCMYQNTKTFTTGAIAFGNSASGIHGVSGMAWQVEKKKIDASYELFKKAYDRKYAELIVSLETALKAIDQCEGEFGQAGWYQRSGFIYFEFMKEKYKRTD